MPPKDPRPPEKPAAPGKKRLALVSRSGVIVTGLLGIFFLAAGVFGYLVLFTDMFRNRVVLQKNEPPPTPFSSATAAPNSPASSPEPASPTPPPDQSSPDGRGSPGGIPQSPSASASPSPEGSAPAEPA